MKKVLVTLSVLLIAILGAGGYYVYQRNRTKSSNDDKTIVQVKSYEDCVRQGYTVSSTNPKQCTTSDGVEFNESVAKDVTEYTSIKGVKIKVTRPLSGNIIVSPLVVEGEVPGNWTFEASFPIELTNGDGVEIAKMPAKLSGDWMTTDLVPFSVSIGFAEQKVGTSGNLILKKDNPSGLAENDDSVTIPVKF